MYLDTRTPLKGPSWEVKQLVCADMMPYRTFLPYAVQAKGPPKSPGQALMKPEGSDRQISVEEKRAEPPNLSSHDASDTTETLASRGCVGCCGGRAGLALAGDRRVRNY